MILMIGRGRAGLGLGNRLFVSEDSFSGKEGQIVESGGNC
jgi:hypothetical protein